MAIIEFKMIDGFPDYRAGSDGSIWSKCRNTRLSHAVGEWHVVTGSLDKDGYRRVILCRGGGVRKYCRVNVVVLTAFAGHPPEGMKNPTAAHNNGNKSDNSIGNLSWKTQRENIADKETHGTSQVGERHPSAILTESEVLEIRALRKSGMTWREIAEIFGRKLVTVYAAGAGKNWRHI